jgi:hypothetical protein
MTPPLCEAAGTDPAGERRAQRAGTGTRRAREPQASRAQRAEMAPSGFLMGEGRSPFNNSAARDVALGAEPAAIVVDHGARQRALGA